ncbi:MAG: glutathione S-transferase N-terminal domain-containing protein [Myxococcota bacterium]|jgi:glutathione S-transferase|nr:glutathione S-transferase N-terminal domain-containing protein [Myxococcota bacterium]
MIQLYGLRMSNYYSLVKALLVEKEVDFEEVKAPPTQEEDNLVRTPMGKMPSIGVDGGYMSESLAIASYLDRVQPEPALLPGDAFAAGKVVELACHLKLDVELVARRCLPEAFFGGKVSDETKESTRADLAKGMKALDRIFVGDPYAAGEELTLADFYTFYTFGLSGGIVQKIFGEDILEGHPKIQGVMARMAEHPSVARVEAEKAS